eukprot:TRINITY_DN10897_c0_g1_i1.p1 TRINITY_DN10897_c0_g1~~TRINITY_DN10897_c0_g1_i1.p1  ORF type:complete len:61 (-),score=9.79 TRINITY_DN10897_c0_g1_i1:105-287(-)
MSNTNAVSSLSIAKDIKPKQYYPSFSNMDLKVRVHTVANGGLASETGIEKLRRTKKKTLE